MIVKKNLVSICIPTYNGESYLEEALHSIKYQTYKNVEVIISDDSSTDRTLEICEKFKKATHIPIYIYNHNPNGIGANWNNCIKKANGNYIKFLFQDDILEPDCIEKQFFYLSENNLEAVCSKRSIIDKNGQFVNSGHWYELCHDLQKIYLGLTFNDFYIFRKEDLKMLKPHHIIANIFGEPIAFLFRKRLFEEVGLFRNDYKQILDIEMAYRILKKHPIGIIEKELFRFRLHDEQESSRNQKKTEELGENKKFEFFIVMNFYQFLSRPLLKNFLYKNYPILKKLNTFYQKFKNTMRK
jgi:glycosyltransferase involved in cell wall biosynthesis